MGLVLLVQTVSGGADVVVVLVAGAVTLTGVHQGGGRRPVGGAAERGWHPLHSISPDPHGIAAGWCAPIAAAGQVHAACGSSVHVTQPCSMPSQCSHHATTPDCGG